MIAYILCFSCALVICVGLDCNKAGEKCTDYSEQNCEACIQSHPCCSWCYMKDFSSSRRCNTRANLLKLNCTPSKMFLGGNSNVVRGSLINATFMDPNEKSNQPAIQIQPQKLNLQLRLKEPITFKLQYKAAKDYPLDLYYLMDLTYSMRFDVKTMVDLGARLPGFLANLTKTYKIAFGYYSDKVTMPFSFMTPKILEDPCSIVGDHCEKGFDFIHALNFTQTVDEFIKMVNSSKTSANIDDLEGGSDAIMQIIACRDYMQWRKYSRKIIVIATDGLLHFAGDGILAGVTKRIPDACLLDVNGTYGSHSLDYDYPSLEEIYNKLLHNKINLLFAAKNEVHRYYEELHKLIHDISYVGKLANQSDNVLDLVRESYTKVVQGVQFETNATDDVKVTFATSCNKPEFAFELNVTNSCDNIEIGKIYTFDVTFELQKLPVRDRDRIVIGERNIAEDIVIDVEYIGKRCECEKEVPKEMAEQCINGVFECGKCNCHSGWTGEHCTIECTNNLQACRFSNETYTSTTCYGHGECDLNKCACECESNYMGKFCEYNQCPRNQTTREVCSGTQGTCIKGVCLCEKGFTGIDCGCPITNETCIVPGQNVMCNGKGICKCGQCVCPNGYSGRLCEYCSNCTNICNTYSDCIIELVSGKVRRHCESSYITVKTETLNDAICLERYYKGDLLCEVKFTYVFTGAYTKLIYKEQLCSEPIPASVMFGVIIGVILAAGIIGLIVWKAKVTRQDRLELERFNKNIARSTWNNEENPIYNSPIRKYFNPLNEIELDEVDRKFS